MYFSNIVREESEVERGFYSYLDVNRTSTASSVNHCIQYLHTQLAQHQDVFPWNVSVLSCLSCSPKESSDPSSLLLKFEINLRLVEGNADIRFPDSILVTGGTVGLGYQAALNIAKQHPEDQIVLCSRTDPGNATASINAATGHSSVHFLKLDLSKLELVRSFAADYGTKTFPSIKALVLNAGLQFPGEVKYSPDNIEMTFAVNHVGHALLFYLLRPHLSKDCRIVLTASGTHDPAQKTGIPDAAYNTAEELAHPTPETAKNAGRQRYCTSKLCNIMWMYALHKRLTNASAGQQWSVTAFDPGFMPDTGLARDAAAPVRFILTYILPYIMPVFRYLVMANIHSPQESGSALADLAVGGVPESGTYWEGKKVIKSSELSYDVEKQEDLWHWTINKVALDEGEKRDFEKVYVSA